ncbi:MAG: putative leader peptide [Geodermatophilaceae bacterium]
MGIGELLVRRLYVDLVRISGAICQLANS